MKSRPHTPPVRAADTSTLQSMTTLCFAAALLASGGNVRNNVVHDVILAMSGILRRKFDTRENRGHPVGDGIAVHHLLGTKEDAAREDARFHDVALV